MSKQEIEIISFPETGTAGLSSHMQLVSSTSAFHMPFGTAPLPMVTFPTEKRDEEKRPETFREILRRIIKRHKEVLDKLDRY